MTGSRAAREELDPEAVHGEAQPRAPGRWRWPSVVDLTAVGQTARSRPSLPTERPLPAGRSCPSESRSPSATRLNGGRSA